MSKFGDLLSKDKVNLEGTTTGRVSLKQNAFANLKNTVAGRSPTVTEGEGTVAVSGSTPEVSSPKPFKFNLGVQNPKSVVAPAKSPAEQPAGAADSMQETAAPSFSEKDAAKDFQSEDQPDQYTDVHVAELKQALDVLKNSISNKELVADALSHIMRGLKKYTFLSDILLKEDCQLMVAGLRESYGVTIAKKQSKSKKRTANIQDVDEVLDQLSDIDIQI